MKLRDCKYGVLVEDRDGNIGMIKGITNNLPIGDINERSNRGRAIPLVEWASGNTSGIHYGNIEIFKEF